LDEDNDQENHSIS